MPDTETWTILRLLEWTTAYLKSRGADSPRLDAELLLATARGCERIELYTAFDEVPDEEVRTAFRELVRRRAEGMPVAYLLGRREFYSLSFRVTPDVPIPPPETELVVVTLLDLAKKRLARSAAPFRVADVGTGSGILAVCAARYLDDSRIVAVDVSRAALRVARENVRQHGVADRVELVAGDLLAPLARRACFDSIISNPPYVSTLEMNRLASDVAAYEPTVALEAGPRGTEVIERLVSQAVARLAPAGYLIFEISPMIEDAARALVEAEPCFKLLATVNDLAGLPRVVSAQRKE